MGMEVGGVVPVAVVVAVAVPGDAVGRERGGCRCRCRSGGRWTVPLSWPLRWCPLLLPLPFSLDMTYLLCSCCSCVAGCQRCGLPSIGKPLAGEAPVLKWAQVFRGCCLGCGGEREPVERREG